MAPGAATRAIQQRRNCHKYIYIHTSVNPCIYMHGAGEIRAQRHRVQRYSDDISTSIFDQRLCTGSLFCLFGLCVFSEAKAPKQAVMSTAVSSFFCLSKAQEHPRPFRVSLVSLTPKSTAFSSFFGFSEAQEHSLFEFLWFF